MNLSFNNLFLLALLIAFCVFARSKKRDWPAWAHRQSGNAESFRRLNLMTPNELEFFGRLLNAFPEYFVFPQVAMSALIQGETRGDFLRIAQQRVDYVLSDQFGDVIAVVELDDRTHSLTKDKVRDRRLSQAGIRTIRFESRAKPSPEEIRAMVLSNLDQRPPLATQRSAIEQAGMAHRSTSTNVVHIGGRTPAKSNFAWIALAWIAVVAILFVALRQLELPLQVR